jgi:hypothetical protein
LRLPAGLDWIPADPPDHVRFIATAGSNPPPHTQGEHPGGGVTVHDIGWLNEGDAAALITGLVAQEGRILPAAARAELLSSEQAHSAAYLTAVADYLTTHATHDDLAEQVAAVGALATPTEIVRLTLQRSLVADSCGRGLVMALVGLSGFGAQGMRSAHLHEAITSAAPDLAPDWLRIERRLHRYWRRFDHDVVAVRPEIAAALPGLLSPDDHAAIRDALLVTIMRLDNDPQTRPTATVDFVLRELRERDRLGDAVELLCSGPLAADEHEAWICQWRVLLLADEDSLIGLLPTSFERPTDAVRVGHLLGRLGHPNHAAEAWSAAADLWVGEDDQAAAAVARSESAHYRLHDPDQALAEHRAILDGLPPVDATSLAPLRLRIAACLASLGRWVEALFELDRLPPADDLHSGDQVVLAARAAELRSLLLAELGSHVESREVLIEPMRLAELTNHWHATAPGTPPPGCCTDAPIWLRPPTGTRRRPSPTTGGPPGCS